MRQMLLPMALLLSLSLSLSRPPAALQTQLRLPMLQLRLTLAPQTLRLPRRDLVMTNLATTTMLRLRMPPQLPM